MNASIRQFKAAYIFPLENGRHIIRSEAREGCFIYQSFGKREESSFGDIVIAPHVSFLADSGKGSAAEWEPQYGPIIQWIECEEDWEGTGVFGGPVKAHRHWHFPFVQDSTFNWSQNAIDREGLKPMLLSGDFDGIFDVLLRWAEHNNK